MIVGSDIIFSAETADLLSQSLNVLLPADGTVIIANDLIRYCHYEETFEKSITRDGLVIESKLTITQEG